MTLGLRCAHVARTPKPKPCRGGCGVLVLTKCAAKYCEACYVRQGGVSRAKADALDPKYLPDMSVAEVDRIFADALAEIKRRPRGEPELRYQSTLAGWNL